jgi:hypothetical protein
MRQDVAVTTTARSDPAAERWTTSDVAAYLGVQVTTVTNYRKRQRHCRL